MDYAEITFEKLPAAFTTLLEKVNRIEGKIDALTPAQPNKRYTLSEAAVYLGLAEATIYAKAGKQIPGNKICKRWSFTQDDLDSFIESGRRKTYKELEEEATKALQRIPKLSNTKK